MKIKKVKDLRVITTVNENSQYIQFWPTIAGNWKWYGVDKITCGFITERDEGDPMVEEMRRYGEVILFKPLNGVQPAAQAKCTRMFLSTLYDDFCTVTDVDMYILNREETWSKWFSHADSDKLLCVCADNGLYDRGPDLGKFPMYYTTAKSHLWKEIVNPQNLSYEDLFRSWFNITKYDMKEAVNKPRHDFSDESLLRYLISEWDSYNKQEGPNHPKCIRIENDQWRDSQAQRRIDRIGPLSIDTTKLNRGYYYDSHAPRPFNRNAEAIKPILDYLNIKKEDWFLQTTLPSSVGE